MFSFPCTALENKITWSLRQSQERRSEVYHKSHAGRAGGAALVAMLVVGVVRRARDRSIHSSAAAAIECCSWISTPILRVRAQLHSVDRRSTVHPDIGRDF